MKKTRRRWQGIKCCNSAASRWISSTPPTSSTWQSTSGSSSIKSLNAQFAQCTKYDILWSVFPCCRQSRIPFSSVEQNMEKVQDCAFSLGKDYKLNCKFLNDIVLRSALFCTICYKALVSKIPPIRYFVVFL